MTVLWHGWSVRSRQIIAAADYPKIAFGAGMVGFGGWVSDKAPGAGSPPPGEIVALAAPRVVGRYYVAYGGLRVAPGDLVREGQPIASLGSSGASDMPHLLVHAQRPGTAPAPFSGKQVPMRIDGRYLVRGDRQ